MHAFLTYLDPLHSREKSMIERLESWANINSWSENLEGLTKMGEALENSFSSLKGVMERIALPPRKKIDSKGQLIEIPSGFALSIKKQRAASIQVLLAGHLDTVYPPSSPFQSVERLDPEILRGPGVADMKGGLVILLEALEAFERSPYAEKIGWEILINPDEEIGSPSSQHLFIEKAPQFNVGIIFEPAFPDGSIVSERKGSVNYTVIAHGKAAHAGRDYYAGRNAIIALARFAQGVETLNDRQKGITVNVGSFEGGGPTNIVPDLAISKVNIRMQNPKDLPKISTSMREMLKACSTPDGISFELHEHTVRPPKLFNKSHYQLFEILKTCAQTLDLELKWQPSGGVCDGNTLSGAGLPTIDTLGAVGGHIHTYDEYIFTKSLVERAKLTASFLMYLAENESLVEEIND